MPALKSAFNAACKLHSRVATLKRPGSPDIYSPARITPSNFFRFLAGPEHTTISGSEFIIPKDTLRGHSAYRLDFSLTPDDGVFKIKFGSDVTVELNFDTNAATVQLELRKFTGWSSVLVTGSMALGFLINLVGLASVGTPSLEDSTLEDTPLPVTGAFTDANVLWTDPIRKGDRIVDGSKIWSIDEVIDMHDLGASVMGYRVRAD